ncbi:MAG: SRPBCC family protein [Protaetiibacter sp.]
MTDHSHDAVVLDGHTVRFQRLFPVTVEQLWAYLTSADGLTRWIADGEIGPSRASLRFHDNGSRIDGDVLIWQPPTVVEFEWNGGPTQAGGSRVRFELSETAEGSQLVLTHSRVVPSTAPDFAAGWHRHLDTLSAVVAGTEPAEDRPSWDELRQHYQARLLPSSPH